MTGTEKQVAWAEQIRASLMEAVERLAGEEEARASEGLRQHPERAAEIRAYLDQVRRGRDWLRADDQARFWIDHRGSGARSLLQRAAVEAEAEAAIEAEREQARLHEEEIRALARRARELFRVRRDFEVRVWNSDVGRGAGEKRVYIGGGYGANWVEYYHTGSARVAPETLRILEATAAGPAAILAYCRDLCDAFKSLILDVTQDNAPWAP